MLEWPTNPVIYEINTWAWLSDLSRAAGRPVTLADVPQAELERLAAYGFDGLWLMGVWQRSPRGREVARASDGLQAECAKALPDFTAEDIVGSPYAVYDYRVDPQLGGDEGLADLRVRLRDLGLRLLLDFVPNHFSLDHPWLDAHPDWLVQGSSGSLIGQPGNYFQVHVDGQWQVFAHGRDPNFSGWTDTVQVDYRRAEVRRAMTDQLLSLADRCDGVRCDMAMLVLRDIFCQTWSGQFEPAQAEFWSCAITDVKAVHPDFILLAEAYWDMEWDLQQQGFDYAYDKRLYDRLLQGDAMAIRLHLQADVTYQQRLARFIENHDERRAAEAFGLARSRAAAVAALTLPGLRLLHEGQLEGRRIRVPIQLRRRPVEPVVPEQEAFYRRLVQALQHPVFHDGRWQSLRPLPEWQGNLSYRNAVAYRWSLDDEHRVVVANLSAEPAKFFLPLSIPELAGHTWQLTDLLGDQMYLRHGDEMLSRGLYIDLAGFGVHIFALQRA